MNLDDLEHAAARGDPLPDGFTLVEQWLYLSLRILHREFRSGVITREQAAMEKNAILKQYEMAQLHHRSYTEANERCKRYSPLLVEAEKSGCDICRKIVRIFDGRKI